MDQVKNIKHKLYTRCSGGEPPDIMYRSLVKQAILMTLRSEEVDIPCVVSVMLTDNKGIRKYNQRYRNLDKTTDVLSFPMQEFTTAGWPGHSVLEIDEDTGTLPLGDIVLSIQSANRQANSREITLEQETVHLIIHSTLHLLGYDHDNTSNERVMRGKEKKLIKDMGYL